MKFIEDMVIGESKILGTHRFAAQEIKDFTAEFDPACLENDSGTFRASGWLVGSR